MGNDRLLRRISMIETVIHGSITIITISFITILLIFVVILLILREKHRFEQQDDDF